MSKHKETGIKGEQIAEKFLTAKGHIILHRNWFSGRKEVDLITQKGDLVVIVEVKTRTGTGFGYPEEAVNLKKQNLLKAAAGAFLEAHPEHSKVQFDVISIIMKQ